MPSLQLLAKLFWTYGIAISPDAYRGACVCVCVRVCVCVCEREIVWGGDYNLIPC